MGAGGADPAAASRTGANAAYAAQLTQAMRDQAFKALEQGLRADGYSFPGAG